MEDLNKRYWKGIEELTNDIEFVKNAEREFSENPNVGGSDNENNRRDFLKLMGFSVAAASLVACEAPIKKAIPYLNKPENLDPSIPNYYASTFFEGNDYCSVVVKTREGRPIKIEGNTLSPITKGKTSAKAQASILSLYDGQRYKTFIANKKSINKDKADEEIISKLKSAKNIRIVSSTIISPSTKELIKDFKETYESTKHITYDSISLFGLAQAHKDGFRINGLPSYDFSKAKVIVSFGADFLGTWYSPVEFATQYAQTRKLNSKEHKTAEMSKHYQFEARMSLTGANADIRVPVKASQELTLVATLYDKIKGGSAAAKDKNVEASLAKAAKELMEAKGNSLVVSGSNDPNVQTIVAAINNELGNYGNTIDTNNVVNIYQGNDKQFDNFLAELDSVDAVIFYGVNPVYDHPKGAELASKLKNIGLSISFALQPDETTELCQYVCPDLHYLESWGDAEPKKGYFSITQPTITPIFETRSAQESLLKWMGVNKSYYDYLRAFWNKNLFKTQTKYKSFDNFWTAVLHDGTFANAGVKVTTENKEENKKDAKEEKKDEKPAPKKAGKFDAEVESALSEVNKYADAGLELLVYPKVSLGNGSQANNPWLQELPDPITKACWGNYASISPKTAKDKELKQGDVIKITADKYSFEVPVLLQPGQADNTIAVALGYGRKVSGKVGTNVGVNVFPLNSKPYFSASISKTDKTEEIAQTQTHNTIMGRSIVQEASLKEYNKDASARNFESPHISSADGKAYKPHEITLWKGHQYHNHSWGMSIDLNSCTGCSACLIACQVENNVPVVGKKEVLMRREMHWIRIDRYYSSEEGAVSFGDLEKEAVNPQVTFMPMMCQHCNNAPCETVCPVLATTHSSEGLNQMAYNRCIGTRYCANNCPYKVRRFNWFHYAEDDRFTDVNYTQNSDLGKMVINPDVTVRSRGVMEKCSLCVQRIQAGKLNAKKEKRQVKDGEIKTACQQACPTDAIVFGDMNDLDSNVSKSLGIKKEIKKGQHGHPDETIYKITEPRAYHVLEEINVKPQVSYLTKIRNNDKKIAISKADKGHGGGHEGGH
jgi:molybdopterin-containing oxidoreductase family iron-sulfur binding subunit